MLPVIIDIPLGWLHEGWHLPIHGYGMMLFLAFLGCSWLSRRLCESEGIDGRLIPDLAICLFVTGILGGRIVYVIQYWHEQGFNEDPGRILKLWDGGLVLYGALFGGAAGYFGYHWFVLRKHDNITIWKMLDIVAPSVALGVALGRIGCLCTGCCYGNVACGPQPEIHFPVPSAGWGKMATQGHQSPYGFILKERSLEVEAVEPDTPAALAGLKKNDVLFKAKMRILVRVNEDKDDKIEEKIEERTIRDAAELSRAALPIELTVLRGGEPVTLPPFTPTSIGLHPTQIYETISMSLLLFLLLAYHPYRRRDGELMVMLMLCYGVHRFLNEMLRTDTDPVAFGLTLSQNISIVILIAGTILGLVIWRKPLRSETPPPQWVPTTEIPVSGQ